MLGAIWITLIAILWLLDDAIAVLKEIRDKK